LSPQHWAKTQKDHRPILEGTGSETDSKNITLYWNQQNCKLTVPLSVATNVSTFQSAPGYQHFEAFCAEAGMDPYTEDAAVLAFPAGIVSDDKDSDDDEVEASSKTKTT
jgi:hypothetical protein